MTARQFRKIALALPGAEEGSHMGHADFRANGRIFATLGSPGKEWAMVKIPLDHQLALTSANPDAFVPAKGAWGRAGCTQVRLKLADLETIGEALTAARRKVPAAPARKPRPKKL